MGYTCAPSSSPTRKTIDVRLAWCGSRVENWTDESSNRRSMLYAPTTVRNYACVLISYHETPPCLPCQCGRSFNYDCKSNTFALAKLVPVAPTSRHSRHVDCNRPWEELHASFLDGARDWSISTLWCRWAVPLEFPQTYIHH